MLKNYASQEILYQLLFGDDQDKKKVCKNRYNNENICLICMKKPNKDEDMLKYTCVDCRRSLLALEGFKYHCKDIKTKLSHLDNVCTVIYEQLRKVSTNLRVSRNPNVPNWCNRDVPPMKSSTDKKHNYIQCKMSTININNSAVIEGMNYIKQHYINDNNENLNNNLLIFSKDVANLQETLATFIQVMDSYIETPTISFIKSETQKKGQDNSLQPCIEEINLSPLKSINIEDKKEKDKPSTLESLKLINKDFSKYKGGEISIISDNIPTSSNTAQRIERIRKQQEKVRRQIQALYESTSKSINSKDSSPNKNLGSLFLFPDEQEETLQMRLTNSNPNYIDESTGINMPYGILWSPSSSSHSEDQGDVE
ncbi:uncharacterized protein CMU_012670 [Cryptosporidium muris RN66]|uniref:Uncharacterized protein n=1 Tax=Cryptosporidium muris (strain RN66) TaxID=441375 RepID=B6AEH6_CRYMR|nr:uncharacterized protein CMU_012670 [Cryptosporidium muris RN66]EEA06593.1 hypothetical protein, conserved [Cryptosporidium muris RN66]|eukprot:XP_002140942.1 hypothetical protein [Cryptosporidium muris RN66]